MAAEVTEVVVEIARLDGSVRQEVLPDTETVLTLKGLLAQRDNSSTADFQLLCHSTVLRNETVLRELTQNEPHLSLQMLRLGGQQVAENVGYVSALADNGDWGTVAHSLRNALLEEGVEQGQVLWMDFHTQGEPGLGSEGSAYYCKSLPSRGRLQVDWQLAEAPTWEEGQQLAADVAQGKELISVTWSSSQRTPGIRRRRPNIVLGIFYYKDEVCSLRELRFVSSAAGSWEGACGRLAAELSRLDLQRGQLLGIDAHNEHANGAAMFRACYSQDLPGRGPLALDWHGLNQQADWPFLANASCAACEGKDVVSITGSSNCSGRVVQYMFWQVQVEELAECVEVEREDRCWERAAEELLEKLQAAEVQSGQVLAIDAHNSALDSPAQLLAVVRRKSPGRGPLDLRCAVKRGDSWAGLYAWAAQECAESEVVSVTGASSREGKTLLLFLGKARAQPLRVLHANALAGSWNGAADYILQELERLHVQRGQLLSLDAHNDGPEAAAQFSALYSPDLPAEGLLRLQYRGINSEIPWPLMHQQSAVRATPRCAMAVTGSSNESGRVVLYVFSDGA